MIEAEAVVDTQDIVDSLTLIFREIFKKPDLVLSEAMGPADIDGWDSLNHVALISSIESRFGIKFRLKELMLLNNVSDIVRAVASKLE